MKYALSLTAGLLLMTSVAEASFWKWPWPSFKPPGTTIISVSAPRSCQYGREREYFNDGFNDRLLTMESEWVRRYGSNCDYQVEFEQRFDSYLSTSGGSSRRNCRNEGINEATDIVLNELSRSCSNQGSLDGYSDGEFFGKDYCDMMFAPSSAPEGDYDIAYNQSCFNGFVTAAQNKCPSKVRHDRNFYDRAKAACEL